MQECRKRLEIHSDADIERKGREGNVRAKGCQEQPI